MKYDELLFEAKAAFDLKPTLKNKIIEYLQHDGMLGSIRSNSKWVKGFKEFKKTCDSELPALSYMFSTSRTKKEFAEDYIERLEKSYSINGNVVTPGSDWQAWRLFSIVQIDALGEPPFKIGEGFEKVLIKSNKLKQIPTWLPKKINEFHVEFPLLASLTNFSNIVSECESLTIYCKGIENLGILSLFEVKGLKHIDFGSSSLAHTNLTQLVRSILKDAKDNKVNIFDAQEQMIEAGFEKNARY